ncbi:MAG: DUF4363 family protein [Bacillota bacterium]|nr:DUF4363 family protein [Bacillota bacterium]
MKNIFVPFILLIMLMLLIILPPRYLNKICGSLTDEADDIELLVSNEDWNDSYILSVQLLDSWQDNKKVFSIFAPHDEIDDIDMEIYKLSQYVKCRDKTESLASIHLIKFLVNHLNELNKVSIQNIF